MRLEERPGKITVGEFEYSQLRDCGDEVICGSYERNPCESFLVAFGEARLIALKLSYPTLAI
jgi:hypothetical protein